MAPVFYSIGLFTMLIGTGWCFLVAGQPIDSSGVAVVAKLFAMTPGFGVMGSGLLFLAIGGALARLDKIVRNTEEAARR